mmetsp:Transcript_13734/g.26629  ORF Transcript_13734/g.26629 Transcript_13734/m.26629 type:complete len:93 (+) Transcript_13734:425-703(+)
MQLEVVINLMLAFLDHPKFPDLGRHPSFISVSSFPTTSIVLGAFHFACRVPLARSRVCRTAKLPGSAALQMSTAELRAVIGQNAEQQLRERS